MTDPQSEPCPKCGSLNRVSGAVQSYNGWYIQFRLSQRFFSWPKPAIKIGGRACVDCGHVEFMVDKEQLQSEVS
jgi:predicted nucleic-acid-binding Zn-ribbon protein